MVRSGTYKAKATGEYAFGVTDKGNEYMAVVFELLEGEPGTQLTWRGFFTEKTKERTIKSLRYCGWTGDNLAQLDGLDQNPVNLVIEDEEYNGKVYAKIQWVNRIGASATVQNAMNENELAAFAKRMQGEAMAIDKSLAAAPTTDELEQPPQGNSTDDAPPPTDNDAFGKF